jgi:hypothetical protein
MDQGRIIHLSALDRSLCVRVLTGFRGDARDSPPDFLDQFFSNRWAKPRVDSMKISYSPHRAGKLQPGGNHAVTERLR